MSVENAVRQVYADGRNKLAHGEVPGLLEDHSETRMVGDELVGALLNEVTPILADLIVKHDTMTKVREKEAYRALIVRMKNRT